MRVGIVGEGPTDVHAITSFLGASLESRGIEALFINLQPDLDRTNPRGGWPLMLKWLEVNPPDVRSRSYFRGGLFDGELSAKRCDVIVFQMDADVLSDEGFRHYVRNRFDLEVIEPDNPVERGKLIEHIVKMAGGFDLLSNSDRRCHVVAVAVESTEAWCIAAFKRLDIDPEGLRGQDLCDQFMAALHRSEGRPIQEFVHISKSVRRRSRFCRKHSDGFENLEAQCYHYRNLVVQLETVMKT